jgi:hypothetical protein
MQRLRHLIEDAVTGLTALDAYALEQIRLEIQGLKVTETSAAELAEVEGSHRLLGVLLQETARNLTLFRAGSACGQQISEAGCYAPPPR